MQGERSIGKCNLMRSPGSLTRYMAAQDQFVPMTIDSVKNSPVSNTVTRKDALAMPAGTPDW